MLATTTLEFKPLVNGKISIRSSKHAQNKVIVSKKVLKRLLDSIRLCQNEKYPTTSVDKDDFTPKKPLWESNPLHEEGVEDVRAQVLIKQFEGNLFIYAQWFTKSVSEWEDKNKKSGSKEPQPKPYYWRGGVCLNIKPTDDYSEIYTLAGLSDHEILQKVALSRTSAAFATASFCSPNAFPGPKTPNDTTDITECCPDETVLKRKSEDVTNGNIKKARKEEENEEVEDDDDDNVADDDNGVENVYLMSIAEKQRELAGLPPWSEKERRFNGLPPLTEKERRLCGLPN